MESWKQNKRIVRLVYDIAVYAFDSLIIKHGYTYKELDSLREGKDIYDVWIEVIALWDSAVKHRTAKINNYKSELAKYYTEEQIIAVIHQLKGDRNGSRLGKDLLGKQKFRKAPIRLSNQRN